MSAELVQSAPATRWRPTPVIAGSMGLHFIAGVGALFAWIFAAIGVH